MQDPRNCCNFKFSIDDVPTLLKDDVDDIFTYTRDVMVKDKDKKLQKCSVYSNGKIEIHQSKSSQQDDNYWSLG